MPSDPRLPRGAYSAMYAVAIAESAPMPMPISVRAASSAAAFGVNADGSAPSTS